MQSALSICNRDALRVSRLDQSNLLKYKAKRNMFSNEINSVTTWKPYWFVHISDRSNYIMETIVTNPHREIPCSLYICTSTKAISDV